MSLQITLLFSALFSLVSALIYSYVGWRLGKRVVPTGDDRVAWIAFTIWWHGLAATQLITASNHLFGAVGWTSMPLFFTTGNLNVLVSCISLCGLVYYLTYLFTGNRQLLWPLIMFYFVFYMLVIYYIADSVPDHVAVSRWNTTLVSQNELPQPIAVLIIVMLLFPQILGSLLYFTLFFRVKEITQKYRILLVSWSMLVWFASPLLSLVGNMEQQDWWQIIGRSIGVIAALTILMAYLPPRWIQQRYGVLSLNDEAQQA